MLYNHTMINPLKDMKITQPFWNDIINGKPYYSRLFKMKWHDWIDARAKTPQEIYAVCDWEIKCHSVSEWRPYGNYIDLIWEWFLFRYAHLSEMMEQWKVKKWDIIWKTGNSWKSSWPHLHFGCYEYKDWILNKWNWYFWAIDPMKVLQFKKTSMTDFTKILKEESPELLDLVKDYSDDSVLTVWQAKALILLLIWRTKKQNQ